MSEAAAGRIGSGARIRRVLSDDRLARRAAKGDERAFAAIFDRYHQSLYRYCLGIVGNSQDAQDALQNAMVKVLRALPGEERRIELKPWLYRIAHNESIDLLRRRRETSELDGELAAPGTGVAGEVASRDRLRRLFADLDQLPERQRGTLVMRELAGLDFAEIGTALGTSPAVARQTLYEARLSLRQMDEGREMSCETVTRALSDGDGRVTRRRDLQAHLRTCASCRRFREEIDGRRRELAALSPLPAVAAAGLLQGLIGGHGVSTTGGLVGALGGGAAKTLGAGAALKGAATVAVVAAVGVGAADRGGLVDAGLPGGGGSAAKQSQQPAAPGADGSESEQTSEPAAGKADEKPGSDGGKVGQSQVAAKAGGATSAPAAGRDDDESGPEALPGSASRKGSSTTHPHGRGHEKQHPSAAAHGQQTAAAHKAAGQKPAGAKDLPARPPKPSPPPPPRAAKKSPAPAGSGAPEAPAPRAADPPTAVPDGGEAAAEAGVIGEQP